MLALSHTHYSLRLSTIKPYELAKRAKELGYTSVAITDYNSVASCVDFYKACKDNEIKPILGCKLGMSRYPVSEDYVVKTAQKEGHMLGAMPDRDNTIDYVTILAKNETGWKTILKLISESNSEENYDFKHNIPRMDLSTIANMSESGYISLDDIVVINGGLESSIRNNIQSKDGKLKADCKSIIENEIDAYGIFPNFYIGCEDGTELDVALKKHLEEENVPFKHISNAHYLNEEDAEDHRVLLSMKLNMSLKSASRHKDYKHFFETSNYALPSSLQNSIDDDQFEEYNILAPPKLPKFQCPDGVSDNDHLISLCRQGYTDLKPKLELEPKVYGDRIRKELEVINKFDLASYFLIVGDMVKWAREKGWLCAARGSAAGCIVSYFLGITRVDPIKHELLFERFMNEGRMSAQGASLPDIDMDFPPECREDIMEYLRSKYGENNVAQLATFGRLQGRAALKAVLRAHEACSNLEMDSATKSIPDEAAISDELADNSDYEGSILKWAVMNSEEVQGYAKIVDGEIVGEWSEYVKQAMRLEGIFGSMGKHAAAVILCSDPIYEYAPLIQDTRGEHLIVGVEMASAEQLCLVKLDILALDLLSKLMHVNKLLMGEIV